MVPEHREPGRGDEPAEEPPWTRPAADLDDVADRAELRGRYDMLLQELRVLLPGVQILVAFLLTAPFAQGFSQLDEAGRVLYGIALTFGLFAIVAFTTPIALHRFGERAARSSRLVLSIGVTRAGIAFLGVSLLSAFAVIVRMVYDGLAAGLMLAVVALVLVSGWIALPRFLHRRETTSSHRSGPRP